MTGDAPFTISPEEFVAQAEVVFGQDQHAVELQMQMFLRDRSGTFTEPSVRADRPGLHLRSILADLAAAER